MSITLISRSFDPDLPVEGTQQVLLLKLADLANDDGWCWPSIAYLARCIRRGDRQTRYLLRELVDLGLIVVSVGTGQHHTNRYRLTLPPKPADGFGEGSTWHASRQPAAGGQPTAPAADCPAPRQPSAPPPAVQRPTPGSAASPDPAPAAAANPPGSIKTPHTPTRADGGGVGVGPASPPADRPPTAEQRARQVRALVRLLNELGVASGEHARVRWYDLAGGHPRADTFDRRLDLIHWCVLEAREQGRPVNYASDVVHLRDQWLPTEVRAIGHAPVEAAP